MNSPDVTTEKLIIESPTVTDKLLLWVSRTFDLYQRVVLRSRSADANKKEFREGEIWWCVIGMNIGTEAFGKGSQFTRPVYILKKLGRFNFIGLPLTSKTNSKNDIIRYFGPIEVELGTESIILFDQSKTFDAIRLNNKIKVVSNYLKKEIKDKYIEFLLHEPEEK